MLSINFLDLEDERFCRAANDVVGREKFLRELSRFRTVILWLSIFSFVTAMILGFLRGHAPDLTFWILLWPLFLYLDLQVKIVKLTGGTHQKSGLTTQAPAADARL